MILLRVLRVRERGREGERDTAIGREEGVRGRERVWLCGAFISINTTVMIKSNMNSTERTVRCNAVEYAKINFYLLLTLFCPILVHPKRFLIQRQDTEMCILIPGRRWDVKECGKLLR